MNVTSPTAYVDFEIALDKVGTYFSARAQAPSGRLREVLKPHFTAQQVHEMLMAVKGYNSVDLGEVQAIGKRLFDYLLQGRLRDLYYTNLALAEQDNLGLRVRLNLTNAGDHVSYPWEYLCDPANDRLLGISRQTPIVRSLDHLRQVPPLTVELPLRILVVISTPTDYPRIDADGEWLRVRASLEHLIDQGIVELDRQDRATIQGLLHQLRQRSPHVLHYVGHGILENGAGAGALLFEDVSQKGRTVDGRRLGCIFSEHHSLRLVFLNACEGASISGTDSFSGVAQSLINQGIPAVIGMQSAIADDLAALVAQEFYAMLANGVPVEAAISDARRAALADSQSEATAWGSPVLYLQAKDGRLFNTNSSKSTHVDGLSGSSPTRSHVVEVKTLTSQAIEAGTRTDWNTAIALFRKALALDPDNATIRGHLQKVESAQEAERRGSQRCLKEQEIRNQEINFRKKRQYLDQLNRAQQQRNWKRASELMEIIRAL